MLYTNETRYDANTHYYHNENNKNFYAIDIVVIGICLLGGQFLDTSLFLYALMGYLLIRIFYSSIAYNFALLLLLIPNLGSMLITIGDLSIPILNIIICVALLKLVFSFGHFKLEKSYIFIVGFFLAYEWGHAILYNVKSLFLLFSWSSAVLYVSLFLLYSRKTYDHQLAVKYFISGVFLSTVFGIYDFLQMYGSLFNNNATIRFHGGAGDANYYSMYIMIAMFSMLYIINNEKNKMTKIIYPALFILFLAFGVLSLSRMFILVISFLCFLLFVKVLFSIKQNKKLFTFIIFILSYLTIFTVYFNEKIFSIVELLFSRFTDFIDDPAALTSNRNVLVEQYMKYITSSNSKLIFGIGIQEYDIRSGVFLEAHNLIVELIVVWGIVGIFVFLSFLGVIYKNAILSMPIVHTHLIGWLPLLCMSVSFMSINALSNESFFLLLVFAIKNIREYN